MQSGGTRCRSLCARHKNIVLTGAGILLSQGWLPLLVEIGTGYVGKTLARGEITLTVIPFFAAVFLVALYRSRIVRREHSWFPALASASCTVVGLILFCLPVENGISHIILLGLSSALMGFGTISLMFFWSARLASEGGKPFFGLVAVAGMAFFATATTCILCKADILAVSVIVGIGSCASCLIYALTRHSETRCDEGDQELRAFPDSAYVRSVLSYSLFGVSFSNMTLHFMAANHGTAPAWTPLAIPFGIVVATVFLGVGQRLKVRRPAFLAYRLMALPVVVAFFPFDPGSELSLHYAFFFTFGAIAAFLFLVPFLAKSSAALWNTSYICSMGTILTGLSLGVVCGSILYSIRDIVFNYQGSIYLISATSIILIIACIIGSNFLFIEDERMATAFANTFKLQKQRNPETSLEQKYAAIAKKHHLTSREADVLEVLAKGYSIAKVQEELQISEGTAISHRRNIYRKLQVHSKDELIDKVMHAEDQAQ